MLKKVLTRQILSQRSGFCFNIRLILKVSIVIATYNRFDTLLDAISSVKNQLYNNIELIVVNDCSTDTRYYEQTDLKKDILWIDLKISSLNLFGYPCPGYVRDVGISQSSGDFIAILDDDDYFYPDKIQIQIEYILKNNLSLVSTEGFIGFGRYDPNIHYPEYYGKYYQKFVNNYFNRKWFCKNVALPKIFDYTLISQHNFIIHSSVLFTKKLYDKVGGYDYVNINLFEDWMLFLKMLKFTDCHFINIPLVYYSARKTIIS